MIEFLGWTFAVILAFIVGWLLVALIKRIIRATKIANRVLESIIIPPTAGTIGRWIAWWRVWGSEVFASRYANLKVNETVINWDGSVEPPQPRIVE